MKRLLNIIIFPFRVIWDLLQLAGSAITGPTSRDIGARVWHWVRWDPKEKFKAIAVPVFHYALMAILSAGLAYFLIDPASMGGLIRAVVIVAIFIVLIINPNMGIYALIADIMFLDPFGSGNSHGSFAIANPALLDMELPEILVLGTLIAVVFNKLVHYKRFSKNSILIPTAILALMILVGAVIGALNGHGMEDLLEPTGFRHPLVFCLALVLFLNWINRDNYFKFLMVAFAATSLRLIIAFGFLVAGHGKFYNLGEGSQVIVNRVLFGDTADYFACTTMLALFLSLYAYGLVRGKSLLAFFLLSLPIVYGLLISAKRSTWVGLIASLALLLAVLTPVAKARLVTVLAVVGGLGLFVLIAVPTFGTGSSNRLAGLQSRFASITNPREGSNQYHFRDWQATYEQISLHPFIGSGFAGHKKSLLAGVGSEGESLTEIVHNSFLYMWWKTGIAGMLAWLWVLAIYLVGGFKTLRTIKDPLIKAVSVGFFTMFPYIFANAFAGGYLIESRLALITAFVIAFMFNSSAPPAPEITMDERVRRYAIPRSHLEIGEPVASHLRS